MPSTPSREADPSAALRQRMAQVSYTDAEDWYLVSKARQGMQVTLAAAREATGRSEVVTQVFTCVTAVDPILAAGLVPQYADVSARTLAIEPSVVRAGDATCAVVYQRTFGIADAAFAQGIRELAHASGALLLEDAAHCVGDLARDGSGRPVADVSVHSFGVEKVLAGTYFGGAVWVNPQAHDQSTAQAIRAALAALPPMDVRLEQATRKYRNQMRVLTRLPQGVSASLRTRWERKGTLEPAVSDEERRGATNHEPSRPSAWVAEQALAALAGLRENEDRRRACVAAYLQSFSSDLLAELQVPQAVVEGGAQPLLRFPVFAQDERAATRLAQVVSELGCYVPAWPRPLLVPGVLDPRPYGLEAGFGAWPVSQRLSAGIVALPTDIDPALVPSVVSAVLKNRA